MSFFGSPEAPEPRLTERQLGAALVEVKRSARRRRLLLVAPAAFAAAVGAAFIAAPPKYGDLSLIAEADASSDAETPWVFGADGVWQFAEPIANGEHTPEGPAAVIEALADAALPSYVLSPSNGDGASSSESLPVSVSTPPTSTPGQLSEDETDWSAFTPEIRIIPVVGDDVEAAPASSVDATTQLTEVLTPEQSVPSGDATDPVAADADEQSGANPSTPPAVQAVDEPVLGSEPADIVVETVLVHSAHVSVTVRVVDDDSSVIDWCNTWVDWGDGSANPVASADGAAACTAACEQAGAPSEAGASLVDGSVDQAVTFTHNYDAAIIASPLVVVATGDGCSSSITSLRLNPFTVVPY